MQFPSRRSQSLRRLPRKGNDRFGVAAVEFAVVAPLMILFVLGLVEVSRLMMVKNAATYASREGARVAVRPVVDAEDVVSRVQAVMDSYGITDATINIEPENLEFAEPGDMVTVSVTVDAASISWIGNALDLPVSDLMSATTMRRESTD